MNPETLSLNGKLLGGTVGRVCSGRADPRSFAKNPASRYQCRTSPPSSPPSSVPDQLCADMFATGPVFTNPGPISSRSWILPGAVPGSAPGLPGLCYFRALKLGPADFWWRRSTN